MARKLYYKIFDDGNSRITENEWNDIQRLQHWYNSEFHWTAGRLALKMYAVFPNTDFITETEDQLWQHIMRRRQELRSNGASENEIIQQLESEGLVIAKRGGYFDNCLASGFTRVAGNEFNAYIVCEFLLKASRIAQHIVINVDDEGQFIKCKTIQFHQGKVILSAPDPPKLPFYQAMISHRHVFAIVDAGKYDHFPNFQTTIADFNLLRGDEKKHILRDWNWLGFENNYDINGDDIQGFDLNSKVISFELHD